MGMFRLIFSPFIQGSQKTWSFPVFHPRSMPWAHDSWRVWPKNHFVKFQSQVVKTKSGWFQFMTMNPSGTLVWQLTTEDENDYKPKPWSLCSPPDILVHGWQVCKGVPHHAFWLLVERSKLSDTGKRNDWLVNWRVPVQCKHDGSQVPGPSPLQFRGHLETSHWLLSTESSTLVSTTQMIIGSSAGD